MLVKAEIQFMKVKALVVDDSQTALLDLRTKLSSLIAKENIYLAQNFEDAVELLEKHEFDVAFVDLQMPEKTGMDLIIDVIYEHPKTKNLPVVVTTAVSSDSLITQSLRKNTFRYLFKPIRIEELKEALSNLPCLEK